MLPVVVFRKLKVENVRRSATDPRQCPYRRPILIRFTHSITHANSVEPRSPTMDGAKVKPAILGALRAIASSMVTSVSSMLRRIPMLILCEAAASIIAPPSRIRMTCCSPEYRLIKIEFSGSAPMPDRCHPSVAVDLAREWTHRYKTNKESNSTNRLPLKAEFHSRKQFRARVSVQALSACKRCCP